MNIRAVIDQKFDNFGASTAGGEMNLGHAVGCADLAHIGPQFDSEFGHVVIAKGRSDVQTCRHSGLIIGIERHAACDQIFGYARFAFDAFLPVGYFNRFAVGFMFNAGISPAFGQ